jgi:hypothetical protein
MRIAGFLSLAVLTIGCMDGGSDKGLEEELGDGKADSFASPSEHGDLGFGARSAAEFTASARFHSWTFTLTASATVDLATELDAANLDTVMYLYKQSASGSWGAAIAKNDDANDDTAASALTRKLGKGNYRVIVKAFKTSQRGAFSLGGACTGAGCPVTTCEPEQALPAATGYGAGCDAAFTAVFDNATVAKTTSAEATIDERCTLRALERKALDFYVGYWAELSPVDTDASFAIDTATLAGGGGTIVDVTDGGDESALSFVFSPAGKLVAYYQHNQSPDVAFFCRTSGAEKALADAEACALSLVATADGEGDGAAACEPE